MILSVTESNMTKNSDNTLSKEDIESLEELQGKMNIISSLLKNPEFGYNADVRF